ncbi:MAG TPA: hypothetical protein VLL97_07210 [Acidobacteriota bacterium]|nr:hypothetical protein [Acidobacteriota bacterium]
MSRSLKSFITEHQNSAYQLYLKLEHRFTENNIIRGQWNAMANDIFLQIESLKAFPQSFWNQIKTDNELLPENNGDKAKTRSLDVDVNDGTSLRRSFEIVLQIEEPMIASIYTPLIRSLRKNWTDAAIDFYILVKAHIVRIVRITESFSGDPHVIQRANLLMHSFEKEVQEPIIVPAPVPTTVKKTDPRRSGHPEKPKDKTAQAAKSKKAPVKKSSARPGRVKNAAPTAKASRGRVSATRRR